jgi:GDP-L-fucose synthase
MRVLLTGGAGMVGGAVRRLAPAIWDIAAPARAALDLTDRAAVAHFLATRAPFDLVIHAAGRVGGIAANMADQAAFLAENALMGLTLLTAARAARVPRLLNLGSSCMYPRDYRQPLVEGDLLAAPLEPTNEGYAIAKLATARLAQYIAAQDSVAWRTFIPCNLYGPGDRFDAARSHLLPAIILKVHTAMQAGAGSVEIWGDGTARREFLYVDDLAAFIVDAAPRLEALPPVLNTGAGTDHSVRAYYEAVARVLGYRGRFTHNLAAPVGMARKLMDSSAARAHGWAPATTLADGIARTYAAFCAAAEKNR